MSNRRGAPKKKKNPLINQRIKEARVNAIIDGQHLTQKDLAMYLQVTPRTIQYWENGKTEPNDDMLQLISEICNVDVLWLKGEDYLTIIENSQRILDNFDPDQWEDRSQEIAEEVRTQAEKWQPIVINLLEYFGYSVEAMFKHRIFYKFCDFMEDEIKHSIKTYIKNFIDKEGDKK